MGPGLGCRSGGNANCDPRLNGAKLPHVPRHRGVAELTRDDDRAVAEGACATTEPGIAPEVPEGFSCNNVAAST
jgi:hypothetical protein